jgi:uncharacterized protein YecT (DUF1311 family)
VQGQPGAKTTGELPKASIRDKGSSPGTHGDLFKVVRLGQNSRHHSMLHWTRAAMHMKFIFLAMALIATGAQAQESDDNPCDKVENDVQTLECSAFSKTTAEDLLSENLKSLNERMQSLYGKNPSQLADISARIKTAQAQWLKTRDADCAVEAFPAATGSKAFTMAQNDCIARMSDERSEFLESIGQE